MKLVALLAASLMATTALTTAAHAAETTTTSEHGHSLFEGTQAEIVAAFKDSLAKDSHGNHALSAEQCAKKQTGCTTPRQVLRSLVELHPELGFKNDEADLAKLPGFYAKLKGGIYKGKLESAREVRSGSGWEIDLSHDYARAPHEGEMVMFYEDDPNPIGFEDCWNTTKKPIVEEIAIAPVGCVRVEWNSDEGDKNYIGVLGVNPLPPTKCLTLQEAGETTVRATWPNDCPDNCNFSRDIEPVTRLTESDRPVGVQKDGSFVSKVRGKNIAYLPSIVAGVDSHYEVVVCRRRADGTQYMAMGLRYVHFQNGVATIDDKYWQLAHDEH
jgi:hypothetical protein